MKQAGKVIVRYNQLDHVRHQLYSKWKPAESIIFQISKS